MKDLMPDINGEYRPGVNFGNGVGMIVEPVRDGLVRCTILFIESTDIDVRIWSIPTAPDADSRQFFGWVAANIHTSLTDEHKTAIVSLALRVRDDDTTPPEAD